MIHRSLIVAALGLVLVVAVVGVRRSVTDRQVTARTERVQSFCYRYPEGIHRASCLRERAKLVSQ